MRRNIKYKPKQENITKLEEFVKKGFTILEVDDYQEKEIDFNLIINKELANRINKYSKVNKLNKFRLSLIFKTVSTTFYCTTCKAPKEYDRYDSADTLYLGFFNSRCIDCKSAAYAKYTYKSDCVVKKEISRIRGAIANGFRNIKYKKGKRTTEILGCSFDYFREYITKDSKFTISEKNVELDHIVPVSLASTLEEVYALNHYSNFELLSAIDNRKKGNRFVKEESLNKLITLHYNYNIIEGIINRSNLKIQLLTI